MAQARVVTEYVDHANAGFMRLNLLFLLLIVAFLPFPARLVAEFIGHDEPGRITATCYGRILFRASLLVSALRRYAVRTGLIGTSMPATAVRSLTTWLTPGLVGLTGGDAGGTLHNLVMIVLGLFLPVAALGYLAIAVYLMVPIELHPAHVRAPEPPTGQPLAAPGTSAGDASR